MTQDTKQRNLIQRLRYSAFIGLALLVVVWLIQAAIILLTNPFQILGTASNRFLGLLLAPFHSPAAFLFFFLEFLLLLLAAWLAAKPVALILYLRAVHAAQEESHKLYTPLTALANIRKKAESFSPDAGSGPVFAQEQQVSILDLVRQQASHEMILGVPGAGKTMALRVYQYLSSQQPLQLILQRDRIAIYVPMKNYSLFLKKMQQEPDAAVEADSAHPTLLNFLYESELPGMVHLRPYLEQLSRQGRLLLLCDGLNEVDSHYLSSVSAELVHLMRNTRNRLVMTCREVDYREQEDFNALVDEGQAACAVIYPLQTEQVCEFVESYVQNQDGQWRHTAGQIMQVIDRSRLRYHCTNPMMLFTLMSIIDKIGVERGKQIDTRGRLLRESVKQLIAYEQQQVKWKSRSAPDEREVVRFLSEVACAARWSNDRNAIQLRISAPGNTNSSANFAELADELQFWLDEHPPQSPFEPGVDGELLSDPFDDLPLLLQFALSSSLIEVSAGGVLSFRHELIAEYFVAEYFFASANARRSSSQAMREEMLENVGIWSEPVAIWAGLMDNPLALAERFGDLGVDNPAYVLPALALALVCVGVLWTPPQAEVQRTVVLPPSVEEALSRAVRNRAAREELARIFTRCAEEGGQEVYRSLLPLIMVEGVDELLTLLDQTIVPDLLFAHLRDAVDNIAYEAQVKRLVRVLGRFGGVVVDRAGQFCLPEPEKSMRLRAAAINVLGGTNDLRAVEPLIARLSDSEPFIVERATNALIRLGPALTLSQVLVALQNRTVTPFIMRIHRSALVILSRFMDEQQQAQRQLSPMQYQRILDAIVPVLTSNYMTEPEIQRQACDILVRHCLRPGGMPTSEDLSSQDYRQEKIIQTLIRYLPSQNEVAVENVIIVLQSIGAVATPYLLNQLSQPSEVVRVRVVEVLEGVHDLRALPRLLLLVNDPSPLVQQRVTDALFTYAPESIPGLIDVVLMNPDEGAAEQAAQILSSIGPAVVGPVTEALIGASERTRLLVQILEQIHDSQAVPALIALLQSPEIEPLLAITVMRALGQFPERRVVPALLSMLSHPSPQLYEEANIALSQLGDVAFNDLVAALGSPENTAPLPRVRRALLGMNPFPGEPLIAALAHSTEAQAREIMLVFKEQGPDASQILVRHLDDKDERVRTYVEQALNDMSGPMVVPAVLELLGQPSLRKVATSILLRYPDAAISPLVELLGDQDRGDAAATILSRFGMRVLRPLISGLDDQRAMARELAQRILVTLVRQAAQPQDVLRELVQLFNPPPPARAREALLSVLSNELADLSLPALLGGLEDAYLIDDVSDVLARLARKRSYQEVVLQSLLQGLYIEERRRGAETALVRIGSSVVPLVGALIADDDAGVARAAKHILREIGVPALSFIWNAQSDKSNPARREAALEVFHSMRTEVIKDELIDRLLSAKPDDVAMAVSLLLERIHDESLQHYADHVMVPELIEYVQSHGVEATNLRVISLLLMLGEHAIIDHLLQAFDDYPQHRKQLVNILLLLGSETQASLLQVFSDPNTSAELRAEVGAVLALMTAPDAVVDAAQKISSYGVSPTRTGVLFPEQLAISLRALGGLLAGGYWNVPTLQELREASQDGTPARELFNVLLGWRYEPQMAKLQADLQAERDTHKKEVLTLTARTMTAQKRIQMLEEDLEQVRSEHTQRDDDLKKAQTERETLRLGLEQVAKEKAALQLGLEQATKEKNALSARLGQVLKENQVLRDQHEPVSTQEQGQVNRPSVR